MSVGVWQQIIIKFSILFTFIIENLTGLKIFIHWQPWYQGCAYESGNHFNSFALGMQTPTFKVQKAPRLMVSQPELPVSKSTDN